MPRNAERQPRPRPETEDEFTTWVLDRMQLAGATLRYHIVDSRLSDWRSDKGFPDWQFVVPGRDGSRYLFCLELKGTKGREEEGQDIWIEQLCEIAGVIALVLYPKDRDVLEKALAAIGR